MPGGKTLLNAVWALLFLVGIAAAAAHGTIAGIGGGVFSQAMQAIELGLDLAAVTAFWFGLSRIAERSGLLHALAKPIIPLLRLGFRGLSKDHPALPMMALNLVANALGLGSAATPFGLKAMVALNEKAPTKGVATDEMILFLVLNSAALNLLPAGAIAMRAAAGSQDPAGTAIASTIVTTVTFCSAIMLNAVFRRFGGRA